jgi:hypothetical protein
MKRGSKDGEVTRTDMRQNILLILAIFVGGNMSAQSVPPVIYTDPPIDVAHPAHLTALRIPTHGVQVNGIIYQASGPGPHPTLVICRTRVEMQRI